MHPHSVHELSKLHQADLLAEAAHERLVKQARMARAAHRRVEPSPITRFGDAVRHLLGGFGTVKPATNGGH